MNQGGIEETRREIQVLSMMDHPNIIKYVESFEDNRYMYIVTELVESSRSLSSIVKEAKAARQNTDKPLFPVNDVRTILRKVLSGILHIH